MTKELAGYQSLDVLNLSTLKPQNRKEVFNSIAAAMREMHAHGFQHGNLYPKHIFVYLSSKGQIKTCFIDLEKTRHRVFKQAAILKDLGVLHRHISDISKTNRLRFFLAYRQEEKLSVESKKMLIKVLRKKSSKRASLV